MSPEFKRALNPPTEAIAPILRDCVDATVVAARESPRHRMIKPFHRAATDTVHRMLNALQPDSYARPHRHLNPPKAEAFVVLRGALGFLTFEDDGRVRDCLTLAPDGEVIGIDLAPGMYHCIIALEPDTVVYEVKDGPYDASTDKEFAPWAPAEGSPASADYAKGLLQQYRLKMAPYGTLASVSWRPPVLQTERLLLRGYEPTDAENIFRYASDIETTQYMAWNRSETVRDINGFLNDWVGQNYLHRQLDYAICLKDAPERVIGGIGVYLRSPENGRYELGYILARPHWGRGLVPEAGRRLLDFFFANPAVERVEAPIFAENARSRRAAEKMGLCLDGVLRSARLLRGRRWDEAIYSRIRGNR